MYADIINFTIKPLSSISKSMSNSPIKFNRPSGKYFSIQLEDSRHRIWENISNDESIVTFKWDMFPIHQKHSLPDLTISVAQVKPKENIEKIKALGRAIYETFHIDPMDKVIGVDKQALNKIGYVENKITTEDNDVILTIAWVTDKGIGESASHIFSSQEEIQLMKPFQLKKLERQFGTALQLIYDKLPQKNEYEFLKSAEQELPLRRGELEHISNLTIEENKEDHGGKVKLFYGTNRKRKDGKEIEYGKETHTLRLGFCEVQIPKGHIVGELERPGRILIWNLPENEKKHIVIKSIEEKDKSDFLDEFKTRLSQFPKKNALLFVHGYNTTFEQAARRTAQLSWDLPFNGLTGFYSWPSSGKIADYLADEAKARTSVPMMEEFIREIILNTEIEQLHIIAHSMGSLLLSLSLNRLRQDTTMTSHLQKIYQLILGAPDIDQDEFRTTILPEFKALGQRRTIYASDHDYALKYSSIVRRHRLRLGQVGNDIFLNEAIDTIEVSNIDSKDSHGYIFESKSLLGDLYFLLTQGLSPLERRLREIKRKDLAYWLFPK